MNYYTLTFLVNEETSLIEKPLISKICFNQTSASIVLKNQNKVASHANELIII